MVRQMSDEHKAANTKARAENKVRQRKSGGPGIEPAPPGAQAHRPVHAQAHRGNQ